MTIGGRWHFTIDGGPTDPVHAFPADDTYEHDLDGTDCICGPTSEDLGCGQVMIVHWSLDGRELTEDEPQL